MRERAAKQIPWDARSAQRDVAEPRRSEQRGRKPRMARKPKEIIRVSICSVL